MVKLDWTDERTQLIAGAAVGLAVGGLLYVVLMRPRCSCHDAEPNAGAAELEHQPAEPSPAVDG